MFESVACDVPSLVVYSHLKITQGRRNDMRTAADEFNADLQVILRINRSGLSLRLSTHNSRIVVQIRTASVSIVIIVVNLGVAFRNTVVVYQKR